MGAIEGEIPEEALDHEPSDDAGEETSSQQGQQPRFRYRITYSKDGPLRYTSQLDVARIWERTLRRAGLALVYSQGFNPRPKIQLAVGLPLGYASRVEIVDAWLVAPVPDMAKVIAGLNEASPRGLLITEVQQVATSDPPLQTLVWSTTYEVTFREPPNAEALANHVDNMLAQTQIMRERRDKRVDIRPLIDHLSVAATPEVSLTMQLSASPDRGTARPDEILSELNIELAGALITRIAIQFRPDAPTG